MPKVSVIMSVYNISNEDVLRLSVGSILGQTMTDLELIVCDDGSTDGTPGMLRRLCESDDRVRLIVNEANMGSAAARNRCISLSTGQYVAVMDADDYSSFDRLEHQVDFLERNHQYDYVGTAAALFNEAGVWGHRHYASAPANKDFLFVLPFVHASIMFRKVALESVGSYRVAWDTVRTEDYDLLLRLTARGHVGANIDEELYSVREDKAAYQRRRYRYRFNEVSVRYKGFRAMGLGLSSLPFVIKPLVVGLIPQPLLELLKDVYYDRSRR